MTETGFAPLPGHPADAIPPHRPMRRGAGSLLAKAYAKRAKVAAVILVLAVVPGLAAAGQIAWKSYAALDVQAADVPAKRMPDPVSIREAAGFVAAEPTAPDDKAGKASAKGEAAKPLKGVVRVLEPGEPDASPAVSTPEAFDVHRPAAAQPSSKTKADRSNEAIAEVEAKLASVVDDLSSELDIRIVDAEGSESGFWRTSDGRDQHFIIVESIDDRGEPYAWQVRDMDTGAVDRLERWAVQVSKEEFSRLSAEKAISGRLPDTLAGVKKPGSVRIEWKIDTDGGMLADWKEDME